MQGKVYSVTEITRKARQLLESEFRHIWIEGEISNFKFHSSGHMYLSLKDETSQISACFFSRYNANLKFEPKNGLQVLALGKISLYEARGQFQLYIERLEPKGLGALQLAFLQLKEKLEKEGLFDEAAKKAIPKYPRQIGVVTSPTGAAIRDILNVVGRRFHGTHIVINPVRVQGEGAGAEVAQAIREMNAMGECDVLIVGRGGGSIEDLWAFNEEEVARAVYASKIPVISAVGHEIDWTICDLVGDRRAPTPSAAAELVVQNREELENRLRELDQRMRGELKAFIETRKQALAALTGSYAFKQPQLLIEQFMQRLDEQLRQLGNYTRTLVAGKRQLFQACVGRLSALSPLSSVERGYSLSFDAKGVLLKDARKVKKGDVIKTSLWRGVIHSEVKKIETLQEV